MKPELPVCTRCCFCLPLRRGLLVWGYIRLLADLYILTVLSYIMLILIAFSAFGQEFAGFVIAETLFLVDFVVTIVFIIGAHKKIVKYMRLFYYLCIAILTLSLMVLIVICFMIFTSHYPYMKSGADLLVFYMKVYSSFFIVIVVQFYFILLLRSEIIKLKNSCKFRFVNNTAEALCSMECEVPEVPAAAEPGEAVQ